MGTRLRHTPMQVRVYLQMQVHKCSEERKKSLLLSVQGRLDVEAQCRGFLELSKEAVAHLVSSIFSDAAFIELFHRAFCSEDWQQGATTASVLATVGDYLEDFEHLIEAFRFKRCALHPSQEMLPCGTVRRFALPGPSSLQWPQFWPLWGTTWRTSTPH